ncbi:hypothetical protein ABFX02_14G308300 [Erythranthe guttata]
MSGETDKRKESSMPPKLKIAMLVVGTRGDVQPFLAVAMRLQEHGHYVRLATHARFRDFVKSAGIDFYPLGGDPLVMVEFLVRNKHIIAAPGDRVILLEQLKAIIDSVPLACTEPDPITGEPFTAQAIIANPPAYGRVHVAEALGASLHIFSPIPGTPTNAFPHLYMQIPLSAGYWLSYIFADLMVWWGIREFVNEFRKKKLNLAPISYFNTDHVSISHLPTAYTWSPLVLPKPNDWGPLVDVVGYCFLDLGSKFIPPEDFVQWIQNGTKPIYFGFGSTLLDEPEKMMDIILEALKNTGQRGIIDRGWGDLGSTHRNIPENVFFVADYPHDWLFPQCSAVVHHGAAGTIATGLRAGCPTAVIPFCGDMFLWGKILHKKGLAPAPIPMSQLSVESLSEAITFMLQPKVKLRSMELGQLIQREDGVGAAVEAFHRHLETDISSPKPSLKKVDPSNPVHWLFTQVGRFLAPTGLKKKSESFR